jgi:hypothetical protein
VRILKSTLTVLGAVVVLLLAGNTIALAATGKALIAGKTTKAAKVTGLTRTTNGPALAVRTKRTTDAPLVVNGRGRVTNLNADTVDGLDSSALRPRSYVWTRDITSSDESMAMNVELPVGSYVLGYSVFPKGTFADGDSITCYLSTRTDSSAVQYVGEQRSSQVAGHRPAVSGSGVLTVGSGQYLRLSCDASVPFTTFDAQPVQLYANPTTVVK